MKWTNASTDIGMRVTQNQELNRRNFYSVLEDGGIILSRGLKYLVKNWNESKWLRVTVTFNRQPTFGGVVQC